MIGSPPAWLWLAVGRLRGRWVGCALLVLAGHLSASESPSVLMPDYDPATITTPQRASQALAVAEQTRQALEPQWQRREYDCYQRLLVNRCRSQLAADRRVAQSRLKLIEVRSRQVIREDEALRRNEAAAALLKERADDEQQQRLQREQAGGEARSRSADAQERSGRRAEEDRQRPAQARENARRLADREADLARRRAEAQARREAGAANAEKELARRAAEKRAPATPVRPGEGAASPVPR